MIQEAQYELLLSERFSKVATLDMRAARPLIARLHRPSVAHVGAPAPIKDVDIRAARFGEVALGSFAFGLTVDIVLNALADAIVVTSAVSGRADIEIGGTTFGTDTGQTIIAHERDNPVFLYGPETEVLELRFYRATGRCCGRSWRRRDARTAALRNRHVRSGYRCSLAGAVALPGRDPECRGAPGAEDPGARLHRRAPDDPARQPAAQLPTRFGIPRWGGFPLLPRRRQKLR